VQADSPPRADAGTHESETQSPAAEETGQTKEDKFVKK